MSYTALYRKYRPRTFEDVKGQDHIVTTLRNEIRSGRIGHAYLFCGTRGTGKTTVAKIFAKAVNCSDPHEGDPCGACDSCEEIAKGSSMNVIEIDAASNNGVDNIRQLREDIRYTPVQGKYIVYIIDEVHMLSSGAFNALLKTLEEPPAYVIFILATTEAHKIPVTISSRCQRYDFRRIPASVIGERVRELLEKEGVQAEDRAVEYIARKADGSMRDALSILDQCISFFPGKELLYDDVLELLGSVDVGTMSNLFGKIVERDTYGAMEEVESVLAKGAEPAQFVGEFVWYLRNVLLIKSSDELASIIDLSSENIEILKKDAAKADSETIASYIRRFSALLNNMRQASQKRVLLEIEIIALCTEHESKIKIMDDVPAPKVQDVDVEKKTDEPDACAAPAKKTIPEKKTIPVKWVDATLYADIASGWDNIISNTQGVLKGCMMKSKPSLSEDGKLEIVFMCSEYALKAASAAEGGAPLMQDELISAVTREEIYKAMEAAVGKRAEFEVRLGDKKEEKKSVDLTKIVGADLLVVVD